MYTYNIILSNITPRSSSLNINLTNSQSLSIGNIIFTTSSISASILTANTIDAGQGDIYSKYFTAGAAFIGNLQGNADTATSTGFATTAGTATSATTAQTASYVSPNTLQNTISSGSVFLINNNTIVSGTFQINIPVVTTQTRPSLTVSSSGVLVIGTFNTPPTAVLGGIYFDGTDFYLGM